MEVPRLGVELEQRWILNPLNEARIKPASIFWDAGQVSPEPQWE